MCVCVHVCVCMCACVYACRCTCIYACVCVRMRVSVCVHACKCVRVCVSELEPYISDRQCRERNAWLWISVTLTLWEISL